MADAEIGSAYLTVKPKVDSKFDSEVESKVGAVGTKSGGKFGGAFSVAAGNLISNAVTELVQVAADTFVQGFQNYADFEQLSGGVEKIFDQADQSRIFADAANAYKDLNLSANQYLESINQVGAAFSATMGDQRGYDVAREGMLAISNYASGTGRNLDELNQKYALITRSTSSYQSIADQFSGILPATSKDFLAQAQAAGYLSDEYTKLTEVPIAEYQAAVTSMLTQGVDQLGLAGNTAKETATTISGSLAGLSASWDNFLTALFDENADMEPYLDALGASLEAAFNNIGQVIWVAIGKILLLLQQLLEQAQDAIGQALGSLFLMAADVISGALGAISATIADVWNSILAYLTGVWDSIVAAVTGAFDSVYNAVTTAINNVQTTISNVWNTIVSTVQGAVNAVSSTVTGVFNGIKETVTSIWNGIKTAIETPINAARDAVSAAIDAIKGFFSFDIQWPHIPLPHFSISGSANPLDWITQGVPSIGIEWYAKGGFVDGATLIGAGESGAEMILPQSGTLMDAFADRIAERNDGILIDWLEANLGATIANYTPTLSRRDFDRMARGAIA